MPKWNLCASNASSIEGRGVGAMLRAILRGSSSDRVNLWVIDPGMVCLFLKMLTSNSGIYAYALGSSIFTGRHCFALLLYWRRYLLIKN